MQPHSEPVGPIRNFFSPVTSQWNSPRRALLVIKTFMFLVAYTFMVFNAIDNLAQPDVVPECLRDLTHEVTAPINQYFTTHEGLKNAFIIVSSLMVDISVLALAATWIIFGKNMRIFFAIVTFFIYKIFLQSIFFFRVPSGYIWGYPGFPSLTMPYYVANDFFFCGQIGLCMIAMLDFRSYKMTIMKYFALVAVVLQFFVLTVTRAHYVIDLITGIVAGHYFYMVGTWIDDALRERKNAKNVENGSFGTEHNPLMRKGNAPNYV